MNIYNTKPIKCSTCGKSIGETEIESSITYPLCAKCNKKEKKTIRKGVDKILVPIDTTEKSTRALDAAIYFSKYLGASITILQVIPRHIEKQRIFIKDIYKKSRTEAENTIKLAKKYCNSKNVVANHRIVSGEESDAIMKIAKNSNYDLIIMGSSGKGIVKEAVFGSISNYVMHNSNVPVLIVKEKSPKLDTKMKNFKKSTKNKTSEKNKHRAFRQGQGIPFSKMKKRAGIK